MTLSDDEKTKIGELAGLFFSPKEVAIIMQLSVAEALKSFRTGSGDFYFSYMSSRLQQEALVRKSVIEFAKKGSSPAQTMALDLLNKSALKFNERE